MKQKYMPPILHMQGSFFDIFYKTTHKTLWQKKETKKKAIKNEESLWNSLVYE